jgi:hypothetical protein
LLPAHIPAAGLFAPVANGGLFPNDGSEKMPSAKVTPPMALTVTMPSPPSPNVISLKMLATEQRAVGGGTEGSHGGASGFSIGSGGAIFEGKLALQYMMAHQLSLTSSNLHFFLFPPPGLKPSSKNHKGTEIYYLSGTTVGYKKGSIAFKAKKPPNSMHGYCKNCAKNAKACKPHMLVDKS